MLVEGANLVVCDAVEDRLQEAAAALAGSGDRVCSLVADLSEEAGAIRLLETATEKFGTVEILVNNAGGGIIRPFLEHTPETLRETINRNLWTTLWCCRVFLPHMLEQSYGRIVNIGADSVHTGINSHAGYNAAKGGVHALTTGLAFEFSKAGISINTVSPGGVLTPNLKALFARDPSAEERAKLNEHPAEIMKRVPLGRFAEMEEIAATVAFLAYPDTRAITGQSISVNGGQWMM